MKMATSRPSDLNLIFFYRCKASEREERYEHEFYDGADDGEDDGADDGEDDGIYDEFHDELYGSIFC